MKKYIIAFSMTCALLPSVLHAKSYPVGGGVFPVFGQVPDMEDNVKGLRTNLGWGHNEVVYGLDISIVGGSTSKEFIGMQVAGFFNYNAGKAIVTGLQYGGLFNHNGGAASVGGIQASVFVNSAGKGKTSVYGIQAAAANIGANNIRGLQVGLYNRAETVRGLQIGVINVAKSLSGLQIGLANLASNGMLPFFPVVNIGF